MKKKTKSSSTYFVKERFFSDIINIFEQISNTPEQYKKSEVLNTFMNRLTSYHKRILVLYFNHILSQSKNIWFFQQFEDNGQDINVRVSLLDLKIVIGQKVYGNNVKTRVSLLSLYNHKDFNCYAYMIPTTNKRALELLNFLSLLSLLRFSPLSQLLFYGEVYRLSWQYRYWSMQINRLTTMAQAAIVEIFALSIPMSSVSEVELCL